MEDRSDIDKAFVLIVEAMRYLYLSSAFGCGTGDTSVSSFRNYTKCLMDAVEELKTPEEIEKMLFVSNLTDFEQPEETWGDWKKKVMSNYCGATLCNLATS